MVNLGPKEPPARKGSLCYVSPELQARIDHYEELFTVSQEKLKEISNHFVNELRKGLSKEGGSIPMNVAWVLDYPTGKETGRYLALDMGGTNLRVAEIILNGDRTFDVIQSKYHMPKNTKTSSADNLWGYIAECVGKFIDQYHGGQTEQMMMCFTFSYPCTQESINHGVLQRWTKGFDIDGVEGHDVVPMVQKALDDHKVPVTCAALINDTTGTLVASNYVDPKTEMGCIFGTGCNAAYYDKIKNIPKLEGLVPSDISPDSWCAINCEYGAFDNEHVSLPRTKFDEQLDKQSPRPNQQSFEKMIAGYTLGEILRLVLIDEFEAGRIFKDQDVGKLREEFVLDAAFLSQIETDPWENLSDTETLFLEELKIDTTEPERSMIRSITELIGTRAARLSMCGVAAMVKKMGMKNVHAGADGSVFNKYPHFKTRAAQALAEIFDWGDMDHKDHPIKVVAAEDGSGVGAGIIAALTQARIEKHHSVGIKGSGLDFSREH